ncbi:MAG TPA: hypothetical protein DDW17_08570 [Deltaproteobacteria bacterium]|nr:hypothetical protein [Deltaproteobacteria bacterium]
MKIGIIGAGKVGVAIGYTLSRKGFCVVSVSDINKEQLSKAKKYLGEKCVYTVDNDRVVALSDTIAITTQDREIKAVAKNIFESFESLENKLFFHTSGAHSIDELSPLEKKGATLGALHPLQTFPDIESAIDVLPGTYIFIEGNEKAIQSLTSIGSQIGYRVLPIEGDKKVLYHLSAVFVCNLLCALLYAGENIMEKTGIHIEAFYPIIRATLKNIEKKGPLMSLTGPIVRGDIETVISHINSIHDMHLQKNIYKYLSLTALEMVKKRNILDSNILSKIKKVLEGIE